VINKNRARSELLDLVRVSSLSRKEGAIARRLRQALEALGVQVEIDDAGQKIGGETGLYLTVEIAG
jgi:tripeptide aminopeptidase